jgi:hypothetical protein
MSEEIVSETTPISRIADKSPTKINIRKISELGDIFTIKIGEDYFIYNVHVDDIGGRYGQLVANQCNELMRDECIDYYMVLYEINPKL